MRLLDTETGQFVEFTDTFKVTYAILSHTWVLPPEVEQTYQELREIQKCFPSNVYYLRLLPPTPTAHNEFLLIFMIAQRTSSLDEPTHSTQEEPFAQESSPSQAEETTASSDSRTYIKSRLLSLFITPLLFLMLWLLCAPCVSGSQQTARRIASIWDHPGLSDKIRKACKIARDHGYRYIWIDSCCIDKTSSSELSEAINSMFAWYRDAAVCYAFLADVPDREKEDPEGWKGTFRSSNWFRRGWTLQELIAPHAVVFLSQEWHILGTKSTLLEDVTSATRIQPQILTHSRQLSSVSVATRMSWAARRRTTRVEDEAYSLLGIFDINMPTLYGEGRRAFARLQEEILRRIPDQSLFAWDINGWSKKPLHRGLISGNSDEISEMKFFSYFSTLLSPSAKAFDTAAGTSVSPIAHDVFLSRLGRSDIPIPEYTITPHGIRTQIPLVPIRDLFPERSVVANQEGQSEWDWYLALLACESESDEGPLVAFICGAEASPSSLRLLQHGSMEIHSDATFHLVTLSPAEIERCRPHMRLEMAYLSHSDSRAVSSFFDTVPRLSKPNHRAHLDLSGWAKALLLDQGYKIRLLDSDPMRSNSDTNVYCAIELVKGTDAINIRCYYCRIFCDTPFFVALSVSCHDASQVTPCPGLWKNFDKNIYDPFRVVGVRGGYLTERPVRATLKNAAGDTLVVRLGLQHVSADSVDLHVEVVGEGTEGSGSRAGEVQGEEMESDSHPHPALQAFERALSGGTGEQQDEETDEDSDSYPSDPDA